MGSVDMNTVDQTTCPNCGYKCAEIVDGLDGYYATCAICGRTTMCQFDTIEEAVFAFKDDSAVEYQ